MGHVHMTFDWIMLEHENDAFPVLPETEPRTPEHRRVRTGLTAGACALPVGLLVGGRALVIEANQGLTTIDQELEATIALEEWADAPVQAALQSGRFSGENDAPNLRAEAAAGTQNPAPAHTEVLDVTFHGDLAAAEALETRVYPDGQPSSYLNVRFYRHCGAEWVPSAPSEGYWGPHRTLETERLVFHYRKRDRAVVEAAAPAMEAAYAAMHEAVGLPPPTSKLAIVVDTSPGRSFLPQLNGGELRVKSPSLLPLPAGLPPDHLMAWQALPLLVDHLLGETETANSVEPTWEHMARVVGQWLVVQHNDLQAAWRADVMDWRCGVYAAGGTAHAPSATGALRDLCIKHRIQERYLWFTGSGAIPACNVGFGVHDSFALVSNKPLRLSQLWPGYPRPDYMVSSEPSPILATTLLDYAVAEYGPDAVARLWQGFHDYRTWEELLPAVFGVSAQEFETGWQEYQLQPAEGSAVK